MNSDPGCALVFWLIVIVVVLCALTKHWRDAKLRKENPQAWVRLKEIENDRQRRLHEKKTMRTKIGWSIASLIFRNWWQ